MLHAIQHIILWGKFRSLNKRYNTLLEEAKGEDHKSSTQHMEENFWYETAVLLEQQRRLQHNKTAKHSNPLNLPLSTGYPKIMMASYTKPEGQYFFTQQPPSAILIVLFSLLGAISMGTGLLWLVVPQLLY